MTTAGLTGTALLAGVRRTPLGRPGRPDEVAAAASRRA
jgi:hypothetical protein